TPTRISSARRSSPWAPCSTTRTWVASDPPAARAGDALASALCASHPLRHGATCDQSVDLAGRLRLRAGQRGEGGEAYKDGNYRGGMSRRAFEVFLALETKLGRWVDPRPRTKTALVYG